MSEYRCSNCDTTYTHEEYMALDRQPLYPEAEDPMEKGGYEKVCGECGSGLYSDKWMLREELEVDGEEFTISTVALLIPHGLNHDQWFETMVFPSAGSEWMDRYQTQEEAEAGHERVVERVQDGQFHFKPTGRRLVLNDA